MPEIADLMGAVALCLPAGMGIGAADPRLRHLLWPGETPGLLAVARRLDEFSAGRTAARQALAPFGHADAALPMGKDRAPLWPGDVVGSISHSDTACLAIAGRKADWAGLGLDLERDAPLDRALWPEVLRAEEAAALMALPPSDRGLRALEVFCAKEAAYKAQYALSRTLFGFDALTVTLQGAEFQAAFCTDVAPFATGTRIRGAITRAMGHVAAVAFLPAQTARMPNDASGTWRSSEA